MSILRTPNALFVALMVVAVLAMACATPASNHREVAAFDSRVESVETVTLLPPRVAVYRRSTGGVDEEIEAWSDQARIAMTDAVRDRVERRGRFRFVPFVEPAGEDGEGRVDDQERRDETWNLFEAVMGAIQMHTYSGPHLFAERRKNFDYTLGKEAGELVSASSADAVVLVVAFDHVETAGRQAARAAGLVVGAITGIVVTPPPSPAVVIIAVIEAGTGDLLWYNQVADVSADIRERSSDLELVDLALRGFDDG